MRAATVLRIARLSLLVITLLTGALPGVVSAQTSKSMQESLRKALRSQTEPQSRRALLAYLGALKQKITSHWFRPYTSTRRRASVVFRLGAGGEIESLRLERSSGDAAFDRSVLAAVRRASPAPVPPSAITHMLETIRIEFDSER